MTSSFTTPNEGVCDRGCEISGEISGCRRLKSCHRPKFRLEISQLPSMTHSYGVVKLEVICLFDSDFSLNSLLQVVFS